MAVITSQKQAPKTFRKAIRAARNRSSVPEKPRAALNKRHFPDILRFLIAGGWLRISDYGFQVSK